MSRLALVTGASSGIGRALAEGLSRRGYTLLLLGRDARALEHAAAACRDARSWAVDLSTPEGLSAAMEAVRGEPLEVVVNNAGFGIHGPFAKTDLAQELAMVRLHIDASMAFAKVALPGMLARRRGFLLNVGSVYSVSPVADQAIYAATKAFLYSFSRSLSAELEGTGVSSTIVLPGVTESKFRERAGVSTKRFKGMSAEKVAELSLKGMLAGKRVVVPGGLNKVFVGLTGLLPDGGAGVVRAVNRLRGLKPAR